MPTTSAEIPGILDRIESIHARSTANLREALRAYVADRSAPDPKARREGLFAYPELSISYTGAGQEARTDRAFAKLERPGVYRSSIAQPTLFRRYLEEQLEHLVRDYRIEVSAGISAHEIPYPFELESAKLDLDGIASKELSQHFPSADLVRIGDERVDGIWLGAEGEPRPLALFDGPRTDFSLARLRHYTGTPASHFQRYVLFTNYTRYVDEFVDYALAQMRVEGSVYTGLSAPGGEYAAGDLEGAEKRIVEGPWRKHQMPAYHLMAKDGRGVTLVNIGVGPSNAKTICDHIAVLRPEVWLMIGHCGGLRPTQSIGDYVLAHAYLRDDNVLDPMLPSEIPIPPIAEVQTALFTAAIHVTGHSETELKKRLRTGTVVTTDDRNWELNYAKSAQRFNQSRAVAIDMESATMAAQGYRFRVPYGTLLCVSDKPLHGELKLPGQANAFYERSVSQHLRIGIETLQLLKEQGDRLHSRKLRSFDEPPLR